MSDNTWEPIEPFVSLDDKVERLAGMKLYKSTEDKKGHDASVHFRVPKNVTRIVNKLRENGPYETSSDVWRDAAWVGLHVLQLRYKGHPFWKSYAQSAIIRGEAAWAARVREEENEFADSLARLCSLGDREEALEYLSNRFAIVNDKQKEALVTALKAHGLAELLNEMQQ